MSVTSVRMAIIKKSTNDKCWWGCGEKGILVPYGKDVTGVASMENSMQVVQKAENRTTIWSSSSIPEYTSRENETVTWKDTGISMFIAGLFKNKQMYIARQK